MPSGKSSILGSPIINNNRNEIYKRLFKQRMIYGYGIIVSFKTVMGFLFRRSGTEGFDKYLWKNPDITGTIFLKGRLLPRSALKWSFQCKTDSKCRIVFFFFWVISRRLSF